MHTTLRLAALAAIALPAALRAQASAAPDAIGRWDLTVAGAQGAYPAWIEVEKSGNNTLVGRIMLGVGSARPISLITVDAGTLRFEVPRQWERDSAMLRVEGRLDGKNRMTGSLTTTSGEQQTWTAVRQPALRRTGPVTWGKPVELFDGKSLAGWKPEGRGENKWKVVNGVLTAGGGGANLVTERTFDDFKLHVEFRYPKGSNSGVYLRGRYEVQIEDPGPKTELGTHDISGVYGLLEPNQNAAKAPGEWQAYDITLVGRRVTVVLNGKTVISDAVIPGITGGALDSDEGKPGPIYIQGDHGPVEYRKVTITPGR